MRIEYENKFSDVLLFSTLHQFLSLGPQVCFLIFSYFIFKSSLDDGSLSTAVITGMIAYLGMWLVQMVYNVIHYSSKKDKLTCTKHVMEIQVESLFDETKYNKSFFHWHGIMKMVHRPGYVAIYVAKHVAYIIPMRAFNSKKHRNEFMDAIKRKLQK